MVIHKINLLLFCIAKEVPIPTWNKEKAYSPFIACTYFANFITFPQKLCGQTYEPMIIFGNELRL